MTKRELAALEHEQDIDATTVAVLRGLAEVFTGETAREYREMARYGERKMVERRKAMQAQGRK